MEPVTVHYCPISTLPYEYIEFLPAKIKEKCIENILKNRDELEELGIDVSNLGLNLDGDGQEEEKEKGQKRGGKALRTKQLEKAVNLLFKKSIQYTDHELNFF